MLAQNVTHKFTVNEYLSMFNHRVLSSVPKTELINGEVIELSPLGHKHAKTQQLIQKFLVKLFSNDDVYVTGSIILDDNNMPEPDVYVLKPNIIIDDNYPSFSQVNMLVEVSDTTVRQDLINDGTGKLGAYAAVSIPLVWVVDVEKCAIHEFTKPSNGIYQHCSIHFNDIELEGVKSPVASLIHQ